MNTDVVYTYLQYFSSSTIYKNILKLKKSNFETRLLGGLDILRKNILVNGIEFVFI